MLKNRSFLKMHGLGNDFVIIDNRADGFIPDEPLRRAIADRHRGVGCDQLIILGPPKANGADVFMHIYNPDGSEAGACGNATRCVARLLFEESGKSEGVVQTISGLLPISKTTDGLIAADFGPPRLEWNEIPLSKSVDTLNVPLRLDELCEAVGTAPASPPPLEGGVRGGVCKVDTLPSPCCINMGNPHAVFFVPDAEAVPLEAIGPKLETHPMFPQRCNIEFAHIVNRQKIRMRVWERGAGITQACGSGSCATLVAAVRRGLSDRRAVVILDGGELIIEWRESDSHVIMAGPASLAFKGTLSEEILTT